MGILGWMIGIGLVGSLLSNAREEAEEERRRRDTPCRFVDGFSEYEFESMVKRAGKKIRRISELTVEGPFVYGTVRSQSGISEWSFQLDFNDYGHITGSYWMTTDNSDSSIPDRLGHLIQCELQNSPF